jgi:hypothetical protein
MRRWIVLLVLLALGGGYLATRGEDAPPVPTPAGAFSFVVLGDAPYFAWEQAKYRRILREIDARDVQFVVHVGDILWKPCADERYRQTYDEFAGLRHPVIYTPGDNEWADCWETGAGGFAPLERLGALRALFFREPDHSLGRRRIPLTHQGQQPAFAEFVENARWSHDRIVFATVHVVGSDNGTDAFPSRSAADMTAASRRIDAAAAWVRQTFAEASAAGAPAVVIALHANPFFERPARARHQAFTPFLEALEEEAARFQGHVLVLHGDHHVYVVDHPVTTGQGVALSHVTRVQVPGSPIIGWVRVTIAAGAKDPFAFEPHTIPAWQYW